MKFNIIPMIGKRNSYPKDDKNKFPKWKKAKFYTDSIPYNVNTMMITGVHPLNSSIQIVVLDFDGPSHGEVTWTGFASILSTMKNNNLEPHMIRRTGNSGFHLIYICDTCILLRNEHKKGLNDSAKKLFYNSVGDVDVRANGGLVFWDCKFSDTDEYATIWTDSEIIITSSNALSDFVDSLRPMKTIKVGSKSVEFTSVKRKDVKDIKDVTLSNCKDYDIPEKYFYIYNQLRQVIKDIWTGSYIIVKSNDEFRQWGIFWRECLARGMPEYVILNRLRTGVQSEYDEGDTITQLRCLKYKNKVPSWKYYHMVFPNYTKV